jgi:hypothetical protein
MVKVVSTFDDSVNGVCPSPGAGSVKKGYLVPPAAAYAESLGFMLIHSTIIE